jgi:hypothetical protein
LEKENVSGIKKFILTFLLVGFLIKRVLYYDKDGFHIKDGFHPKDGFYPKDGFHPKGLEYAALITSI